MEQTSKIIHLVRHGEAYHNAEGQVELRLAAGWLWRGGWRKLSVRLLKRAWKAFYRQLVCYFWPLQAWIFGRSSSSFSSSREAPSPHEHPDASLTPPGWQQVAELRQSLQETGICYSTELVIVSPLTRTLQTAAGAFGGGEYKESDGVPPLMVDGVGKSPHPPISSLNTRPILALELCREQFGIHPSGKRSPISKYRKQFPAVDFSELEDDEDKLWKPDVRESEEALTERIQAFLQWLLRRKEQEIAVVSHGAFLSCLYSKLCNDCLPPGKRLRWPNCGVKSITLTDHCL